MAKNDPVQASAGGKAVICDHCAQGWFWQRRAVMSSSSASLLGFDGFSPEALMLTCTTCGKIQLFDPQAVALRGPQA